MSSIEEVYAKHKNLKLAAQELGMPWQTLYVKLKASGAKIVGDKLRYGTDRDRLAALAESEFLRIVPWARDRNKDEFQSRYDFDVGAMKVDVKASRPRQLNAKYEMKSWSFSIKKQRLICDFIVCFCYGDEGPVEKILLVPSEFFVGLQTVSVSCRGASKWLDYSVSEDDLREFFANIANYTQPKEDQ